MDFVAELINNKLAVLVFPILVLVLAGLLFTFGIKTTQQPHFDKLSSATTIEDRKSAGSKKRKSKEKKNTSNGHVLIETKIKKSPVKEQKKSPAKEAAPETPKLQQSKKQEANKQHTETNKKNEILKKRSETIEEVKNKKNKKSGNEKPLDYDDGNWETVPSKADKKKKVESPAKKDKKGQDKKKTEKTAEIDKLAKEVVNKELREKNKQKDNKEVESKFEEVKETPVIELPAPIVEEKQGKEKDKKRDKKELKPEVTIFKPVEGVKEIAAYQEKQVKKSVENAAVFDELTDTWTEPKAKKSKKKARRDN